MIHWALTHIGAIIAVGFWIFILGGLFLEWRDENEYGDNDPSP